MVIMKNLLYTICALVALLGFSSCGSKPADKKDMLPGNWELTGMEAASKSVTTGGVVISVYLSFGADGSFALYQQLGEGRFRYFDSTWSVADDKLTGVYSDGTAWGTSYDFEVTESSLVLTDSKGGDSYTYSKCEQIPAEAIQ